MKKSTLLLAILVVAITFTSCQTETDSSQIRTSTQLLDLIQDPPASYRPAPFWDWNDQITESEIDFQMKKFKEGGVGGVFVHPRPGLVTEYLSEEWNRLFTYTVEVARKLEMDVWIYDENSYPSGFAGGHVQDRYPDSYRHGTGLGYKLITNLSDTADIEVEALFPGEEEGTYQLFYKTHPTKSWWYGGFPYVDLLYPGVTDTFMRVTMEGYEKYNREDFGSVIKGVFTDEPNLEAAKSRGTAIRWTPDLYDQFEQRWGYSLKENLPSLVTESGNWTKVRHDYFTLMLELFLDRWAMPWFDYTEANNLAWTGHYWEHGWPYPGDGIDESAFYMYHQMPGVDMLGRSYDPEGLDQQWGNTRAVRELGSAANQSGSTRRLSETWGGAGWQISFKELKRLVDWQVSLGVNFVNPHLSYYSMQGVRKYDYPPTFSYHEPWWENFSMLGDYIGRICLAMSTGEQVNNTLILQPNSTAWMYHSATKNDKRILDLSTTFKTFIQSLEAAQIEYDLGSEQVMKRFGNAGPKGLTIRQRTYNLIVIPPGMRNLQETSVNLLESYLTAGGKVLALSDSVDYIDGAQNPKVGELAASYPEQWIRLNNTDLEPLKAEIQNPDIDIRQIDLNQGQIFHQRRHLDDGQLLFVVNSDLDHTGRISANIPGKVVYEIDLQTGLAVQVKFSKKSGKVSFESEVPGAGSRLFVITNRLPAEITPSAGYNQNAAIVLEPFDSLNIKRLKENVLTVDYLELETRQFNKKDLYYMNAMYDLFAFSELPTGNPWQHKIQFKKQYLEMDNFDSSTWFKARYRFTIDPSLSPDLLKDLTAVIERPGIWTVSINGTPIEPQKDAWWLDRHFPVYSIGHLAKPGENMIELTADRMSVFAEIMPIYILGDFSLEPAQKGFTISAPNEMALGSWVESGLPFYSNQVAYQSKYHIDNLDATYKLQVEDWKGSVAEVWVNGAKAGLIAWDPMELDITDHLKVGDNSVELRVTGTLKNTLGYHHRIQTGWIDSPSSWNQAPAQQPGGQDYIFFDYGLMGKLKLISQPHP